MADAQVWTVIALLAAAMFAIVIEMRRMNDRLSDRMTGGFASLRQDINDLRLENQSEHAQLRAEIVELRHNLRWHVEHDHRSSG